MSWENENNNTSPRLIPRHWIKNVRNLSEVTPSGKLTTMNPKTGKVTELNPNAESDILSFLTPRRITHKTKTPANILKYVKFERNLKKAVKDMNYKKFKRAWHEEEARNKLIRNAEDVFIRQQAENVAQQAQEKEEYNEYIQNATRRSSPEWRKYNRNEQNRLARTSSRKKRGIPNNIAKMYFRNQMYPRKNNYTRKNNSNKTYR